VKIKSLLKEAALERPGVGMPLTVMHMSKEGWVPAVDEYLDQDDTAWSMWFLLLYRFLKAKDYLS
jgi:hypothetical protein